MKQLSIFDKATPTEPPIPIAKPPYKAHAMYIVAIVFTNNPAPTLEGHDPRMSKGIGTTMATIDLICKLHQLERTEQNPSPMIGEAVIVAKNPIYKAYAMRTE